MIETVTVEIVPLASSSVEYAVSIPAAADWFTMQLRGAADLRVASESGETGRSRYFTLKSGTRYDYVRPRRPASQTERNSLTLYVRPSSNTQILELLYGVLA